MGEHREAGDMPFLEPGQSVVYTQCIDPECPNRREGYEHAHAGPVEDDEPAEVRRER